MIAIRTAYPARVRLAILAAGEHSPDMPDNYPVNEEKRDAAALKQPVMAAAAAPATPPRS
jgi:hypothetical protein